MFRGRIVLTIALTWFCSAGWLSAATFGLFTYTDNGTFITITDYPTSATGAVEIPSSIINKPVTSIGSSAFRDCSGLTSVTIPSSVTRIQYSAFDGCSGLTSVTIPFSVTSIGYSAFANCSGLTFITVDTANPNYSSLGGVLINKAATKLIQCPAGLSGSYMIPSTVTSIGDNAFEGCSRLTIVTIPSSVTSIGISAFDGCIGLTNVTIPSSVTSIRYSAFYGCSGLTSVTIPASVTTIENNAFYGCRGLTSVTIPASVTSIGSSAFSGCIGLTSVTIPSSVTSIGDKAFDGCIGLTSVTIPSSVTSIGISAFDGCIGLTSVTIPSSVTSIGISAFDGCIGLTSVTIPSSVTSIGSSAFRDCSGLASILVDAANPNYSSLGGVFYNKAATTLIQCPGGFTGSYTIPSSVTTIGSSAFSSCTNLSSIVVDAANPNYSSLGGVLFNKDGTTLIQYPAGLSGNYTTPASVTRISDTAFAGCTGLAGVTIRAAAVILTGAFRGCSGLTTIKFDSSNNIFDDAVFIDCSGLTRAIFMGNAPTYNQSGSGALDDIFIGVGSSFQIYYFDDSIGFTSPMWYGYSSVNMGARTQLTTWLINNQFPYNADLKNDHNGDGVSLLMAYALDLDPRQDLSGSMPKPGFSESKMDLSFYAGSEGVSYIVEASSDLEHWSIEGVSMSDQDVNHMRTATIPRTDPCRFLRLRVSR